MTYLPDGAPYTYRAVVDSSRVICVGWLDAKHPFTRGAVDQDFLVALRYLCINHSIDRMRGYHWCNLGDCDTRQRRPPSTIPLEDGDAYPLGDAEIWVEREDGIEIAAPNLVYHYVTEHQYRPPDYFVDAVLRQAGKTSP